MFKLVCILGSLMFLVGCGSTGGSSDSSTPSSSSSSNASQVASKYITFNGNDNDDGIIDATNKVVRFLKSSYAMEYNGTTYSNILLSGTDITISGKKVGSVNLVGSTSGGSIAGMIGTDGKYLQVNIDSSGKLTITNSSKLPATTSGASSSGSSSSTSNNYICTPSSSLGTCSSYYQCTPGINSTSLDGYYHTSAGDFHFISNDGDSVFSAAGKSQRACGM